jgi:hypothetical protein
MIRHFLTVILFSTTLWANNSVVSAKDFLPEKVKFTFMSSDGSVWINCSHKKTDIPHGWDVTCGDKKFSLHLFMQEYSRENESTYEFHYWVDEIATLFETHTQSTWVTIDRRAQAKRVVSYLGFQKDSTQLRFEVNLQ